MKITKTILAAVLLLLALTGNSLAAPAYNLTEKKLEQGFVQIYDFGAIKLHAYQTADLMQDECFVLETAKNLVAIESPPFNANIAIWNKYINTLNKPLTDILISAHPGGGNWYGNAKSHATLSARKAINSGNTKALTEALGQSFGPEFNTKIPTIDFILNAGTNNIGSITLEIIDSGNEYNIVIPAIGVIYTHMLGADSHSILAGRGHINAVLNSLNNMQTNGYQLILSSHHTPETQKDVATKIAYVKRVQKLAGQSKNKADFIEHVKKEFSNYGGLNYLDMTAGFLFP
ncbi:hypothetical protein LJB93_01810 [Desulfovibrio sp. OttesenSCG-928-F07]|nr:hypothetical protein [Desulfovibrio sp. OttesenSCG-928-F07]